MNALARRIAGRIAEEGPLPVSQFMAAALGDPEGGYYVRGDPIGAQGDFITAPEVSQMFGELIGLWCAAVWQSMGAPDPVTWIELGPGRGTLAADALRAVSKTAPTFAAAADIHLVETSPVLREHQRTALPAGTTPTWHETVEDVPVGPILVVANEFFDALPIRQYVKSAEGWRERCIGLAGDGQRFAFADVPCPPPDLPPALASAHDGAVVEVCEAGVAITGAIGERVARDGGAALVIDYGHARSAPGDTLQAVRRHAFADVLDRPGETDLTTHVDFEALGNAATAAGARVFGPVPQGVFLGRLGIEARAATLARGADADQTTAIHSALRRLAHPREMGLLFKVLAITGTVLGPPPGFDAPVR